MAGNPYVPDPRAAAATAVETGDTLVRCERVMVGSQTFDFPAFLPGAPEYAGVAVAESRADALYPQLFENLDTRDVLPMQPNAPLVFNFRGAVATAVTGAITGMEAFANWHISRTAGLARHLTVAGEKRELGYLYNMALNERYADVLPELLGKPKPTQESWWQTFRRLQQLAVLHRHGLYDPQERKGRPEPSLAERVYNAEYRGAAHTMRSAFEHFSPGWFSASRVDALTELTRPD